MELHYCCVMRAFVFSFRHTFVICVIKTNMTSWILVSVQLALNCQIESFLKWFVVVKVEPENHVDVSICMVSSLL